MKALGIDTGGTFTDFVLRDWTGVRVHKVLSTPAAPEQAILQGIAELGLDPSDLRVIHGSTVATNAVLEGKGVRTAYVTNRGLADLLTIGRQARPDLYDLQPPPRRPPVPPELCLETGGRLAADGSEVEPLTDADLTALRAALERLAPEAVAINLLYSYLDDGAEQAIAAALPPGLFVARSGEVLPVAGEYERGIATWLNAWIGPLVARYLERLAAGLPGARIAVMQSSGEAVAAAQTARQAVRLLLSGPAGGLVGAGFVGRLAGCERLLTFDMGGTSTDVALIDGAPQLTRAGRIAGWPVAVPMVDMHTIGAGGGSIARLDAGGALLVGPESAGADPGPACYGRGGREPTVTDANLILGRLRPEAFLGGRMRLDVAAAQGAVGRLAAVMGLTPEAAARGIVAVANEHMARALRVISVQRGSDPRDHVLTCFGGAGGLHVCALAEALGMTRALAPVQAGVLSALGMLVAPPGRVLSRTWLGALSTRTDAEVEAQLAALAADGIAALEAEGRGRAELTAEHSIALRYQGQSYTLDLPWQGCTATETAFHAHHEARYGHRLDLPVELVDLRVRVTAPALALDLAGAAPAAPSPPGTARVAGIAAPVPVLSRGDLAHHHGDAAHPLAGPAIVIDDYATTWLAPGWHGWCDTTGNLRLERTGA
ncbi:N-methylhydantoinase A/acetone carboxylase, beta subunit [Thioflavicoccus mobilis 8321]|uniref:N-methylhydantoinase A/acetone carboxylase, beta subunit n=1 Tax=Thioflavicoccus mobilis 8321 TaxID=765912 RepID=L0GUM7_9GAMM|nr:hydantoinase/oxoprolinase family protein [Thioflavicoccus mobilis]AGA88994.1 N-methylhydantoinase A/acetone carboxylase, beta subunit [Thioflavicoccus mobilis 8321]